MEKCEECILTYQYKNEICKICMKDELEGVLKWDNAVKAVVKNMRKKLT